MSDSIAKKTFGDSIYSILFHSRITAMLVKNDSTGGQYDEYKVLTKEDSHLLRFFVTDPAMFSYIPK